jgi:hypothetical protein
VSRRSNRNHEEKEEDMDKELGIQTNLESVFKKDGKGGKVPSSKGPSSIPSQTFKGGASKSASNEISFLEL